MGFEGEARFLRFHTSEEVTESNYIGGIRVLIFRSHGMEPYAKFLAGMGKITLPFGYAHGSFLAYAPGAGLDVAINHNVTVRAIDFEYQHWPQFPYGSFSPYGISCGIRGWRDAACSHSPECAQAAAAFQRIHSCRSSGRLTLVAAMR